MTRINIGISPKLLSDKHLLAEHREIKRIPNHLAKYKHKCTQNIPAEFSLGTGHMLFFINKGRYTFQRYMSIYQECCRRVFNVTYFGDAWFVYRKLEYRSLYKLWMPSMEETVLLIERLQERDPVFYKDLLYQLTRKPFSKHPS